MQTQNHQVAQDKLQPKLFLMQNSLKELLNQNETSRNLQGLCKDVATHSTDSQHQILSNEEKINLFQLYKENGPKWSYFATLTGKKTLSLKNLFYSTLRKLFRKLSKVDKQIKRTKRPLSFNAFIRPLEAYSCKNALRQQDQKGPIYEKYIEIRNKIIDYMITNFVQIDTYAAQNLINMVHQFNWKTKSIKFKKIQDVKLQKQVQQNFVKIEQLSHAIVDSQNN